MIRVIDARSGANVKIGQVVSYPDGEWWELVGVRDRLLTATAIINDHTTGGAPGRSKSVPLTVRFLHPAFLFERVGFFPS